jgi:hypothetical protein
MTNFQIMHDNSQLHRRITRICLVFPLLLFTMITTACSKNVPSSKTIAAGHGTEISIPSSTVLTTQPREPVGIKHSTETITSLEPTATVTITPTDQPNKQFMQIQPGSYILFSSLDTSNENPVTSDIKMVSFGSKLVYTIAKVDYDASTRVKISPDRDRLAYIQEDSKVGISVIKSDPQIQNIIPDIDGCFGLDWSLDSTKLALACGDIYIFSLSNQVLEKMDMNTLEDQSYFDAVSWSPDGKWLIIHSAYDNFGNRDTGGNLYTVQTGCLSNIKSCSSTAQLFEHIRSKFFSPTWSPDSQAIASFTEQGIISIWQIQSKENKKINLPEWQPALELAEWGYLAWSPDGNWLAYSQANLDQNTDSKSYDIWVVPVNGGSPKRILNNKDFKLVLGWTTFQ